MHRPPLHELPKPPGRTEHFCRGQGYLLTIVVVLLGWSWVFGLLGWLDWARGCAVAAAAFGAIGLVREMRS